MGFMIDRIEEREVCSGCCSRQKATCTTLTDLIECGSMKKRCCWRKEMTKELYLM